MAKTEAPRSPAKEFERMITTLGGGRHQLWRTFADFCELGAMAISNSIVKSEAREQRYFETVKRYEKDEADVFAKLIGLVVEGLSDVPTPDFLGVIFQNLELASHWHGQFFTPMEISRMMAGLLIDVDYAKQLVEERGYITMQEPACGSGGMVIATAHALREAGIEPQRHLFVHAVDVDTTAAYMAYIQLSLLGIPAAVIVGNTLTLELRETLLTPMYHMGLWERKLRRDRGALVQASKTSEQPAGQARLW